MGKKINVWKCKLKRVLPKFTEPATLQRKKESPTGKNMFKKAYTNKIEARICVTEC